MFLKSSLTLHYDIFNKWAPCIGVFSWELIFLESLITSFTFLHCIETLTFCYRIPGRIKNVQGSHMKFHIFDQQVGQTLLLIVVNGRISWKKWSNCDNCSSNYLLYLLIAGAKEIGWKSDNRDQFFCSIEKSDLS